LFKDRILATFIRDVLSDNCEDEHHGVGDYQEWSTILNALGQNGKFLSRLWKKQERLKGSNWNSHCPCNLKIIVNRRKCAIIFLIFTI
jgi:hypothetical protein